MAPTIYVQTRFDRARREYTDKYPSSQLASTTKEERARLAIKWYAEFGGQYPVLATETSSTGSSSPPGASSDTSSKAVQQYTSHQSTKNPSQLSSPADHSEPSTPSHLQPTSSSNWRPSLWSNPFVRYAVTVGKSLLETDPVAQQVSLPDARSKDYLWTIQKDWTDADWDVFWRRQPSTDMQKKFTPADWDAYWMDQPSNVPPALANFLQGSPGRFGTLWNSMHNPYVNEMKTNSALESSEEFTPCWPDPLGVWKAKDGSDIAASCSETPSSVGWPRFVPNLEGSNQGIGYLDLTPYDDQDEK
ncbi:hypothetical protein BCR39DRAFT_504725 [Naematelia encephala]|uniref:Uncharacterized protein n=1 Tax=Naematelia encephala TaxID=71784 RepID=A0A1Y2B9W3_9TREE|nr:hypothetical protein BCR39DRAFT_504725 [Naematelia encephala]